MELQCRAPPAVTAVAIIVCHSCCIAESGVVTAGVVVATIVPTGVVAGVVFAIVIAGVVVIATLSRLCHGRRRGGRGLRTQLGAALAKPPWLVGHAPAARVGVCIVGMVLEVVGSELRWLSRCGWWVTQLGSASAACPPSSVSSAWCWWWSSRSICSKWTLQKRQAYNKAGEVGSARSSELRWLTAFHHRGWRATQLGSASVLLVWCWGWSARSYVGRVAVIGGSRS